MAKTLTLTNEQHAALEALLLHAKETGGVVSYVEARWETIHEETGDSEHADNETTALWGILDGLDTAIAMAQNVDDYGREI